MGELYINIGSNTNGGVPGSLSGSGRLKENYFSAATNVADLAHPSFDGFIEYDAPDDGSPVNATGVSVFAPGLRNPFGLTLHSNGNLYGTDNGPNTGYGKSKGKNPSTFMSNNYNFLTVFAVIVYRGYENWLQSYGFVDRSTT